MNALRRSLPVATLSAVALVLSACGGDNGSDDPTTPAAETTTEDSTTTEETTEEETTEEATTEEETTEEETEDEETEESEAGGDVGTRDNPYAIGDSVELGDWTVVINEVNLDATDEVLAENQFNDPPEDGYQFVLVNLSATYDGSDTGTAWMEISGTVVGSGGNTHRDSCGLIHEDLFFAGEQFPGATETGNICVPVASDQVDGARLILEERLSLRSARVFVALD